MEASIIVIYFFKDQLNGGASPGLMFTLSTFLSSLPFSPGSSPPLLLLYIARLIVFCKTPSTFHSIKETLQMNHVTKSSYWALTTTQK